VRGAIHLDCLGSAHSSRSYDAIRGKNVDGGRGHACVEDACSQTPPNSRSNGSKTMKSKIRRVVTFILGSRYGLPVSHRLAQIGMLGLGVDIGSEFEINGEEWLSQRLFKALPGAVCADVGANIGEYTETALRLGASRILAFEPAPVTFQTLNETYGSDKRVELLQTALGEDVGQTVFYFPLDRDSTFASRDIHITTISNARTSRLDVPLTTLDRICQERNVDFDVIKIDVEGFELEVLKGAEELLVKNPPQLIQFEFNSHHRKRHQTLDDFAMLLPQYRMFRLASRSLRPIDLDRPFSTIYAYQNIVCIHEASGIISEFT